MLAYIDIETGYPTRPDVQTYLTSDIKPRKNLVDPVKIQNDIAAKTEEAMASAPLSGLWGEVLCVGIALNEQEPVVLSDVNEKALLEQTMRFLRDAWIDQNKRPPQFIGFNISEFDLPFLWKRCLVHGIKPPYPLYQQEKPWSSRFVDLRHILGCGDMRAHGTLKDWCYALGISMTGDIDGAEVPAMWQRDRQKVIDHCRADVIRLQEIHRRIQEIRV